MSGVVVFPMKSSINHLLLFLSFGVVESGSSYMGVISFLV